DECRVCRAINEGRFLDLIEIDAASNTGVDDIRSLREKINFSPSDGRLKVYIIDEVHMLSTAAFNALLKTLEEPPAHVIFVLATTEEHKVPITIKSRCQQFNFRLLTVQEITSRLNWLAEQETLQLEPEALSLIARHGAGSLRDAESLLDQLVTAPGDAITLERTQLVLGTASAAAVSDLTAAWLVNDGPAGLGVITEALATGTDPRQFCRQMVSYLRLLLLLQTGGSQLQLDVPDQEREIMIVQAGQANRPALIEMIKRFNEASVTAANTWQPQLPLELAFIESLTGTAGPAISAAPMQAAPVAAPLPTRPAPASQPEPPPVAKAPVSEDLPLVSPAKVAPAPVAATQPKAAPVADGDFSLAQVQAQWQGFMTRLGAHDRNLPPLLAMCKPLATEGSALVLGFDFPILRDKFDQPENKDAVANILSGMFGGNRQVKAVVTSDYTPPQQPALSRDEFEQLANELGGVVTDN
ncbi:MAG: DNA polymerase III subunit gamma/tau, partial [Ardenticatenales bacterium]|nr:DNA polymerase III subunit gamma/tau [Ardenticatenales bacterium]